MELPIRKVGLLKSLSDKTGFGKVGTLNEDVWIHVDSFSIKPTTLAKGTSIIFEVAMGIKGLTAVNVTQPTSFQDFDLILTYFEENPNIPIQVPTNYGSEIKQYNLVQTSLEQLFSTKSPTEVSSFCNHLFDENSSKNDVQLLLRYLSLTKKIANGLKIELDSNLLKEYNIRNSEKFKEQNPIFSLEISKGNPSTIISNGINAASAIIK